MTTNLASLAGGLASVCGTWRELDPEADAELSVDGVLPRLWCEPNSADELAEVLKLAHRSGAGVVPRGGGTRMSLGLAPRTDDLLVSTRGLNKIIEYEPADLTVTVEAGLLLGELQRRLSAERQLLALDPPSAERATLGGVVASNASGPLRLQYGSARDLVIGTRVANADGVLTKAGGRVVKNVAGYDLNKLYTGSLGTLGVIVELSFKLHPLPEASGTVFATFDSLEQVAPVVRQIMRSQLGQSAVEVLDSRATGLISAVLRLATRGCALAVLVRGFEKAVARAEREIAAFCQAEEGAEIISDEGVIGPLWADIQELADASRPNRPVLKVAVPPSRSLEALASIRSIAAAHDLPAALLAHAGVGLVYVCFEEREWTTAELGRLAQVVTEGRRFTVERDGSLVVESCPSALKERVDVWGEIGPRLRLMRSLKEQLDPTGILNPGRFVGGI